MGKNPSPKRILIFRILPACETDQKAKKREKEAIEWAEATFKDVDHEAR
jgi:hypothetical protein